MSLSVFDGRVTRWQQAKLVVESWGNYTPGTYYKESSATKKWVMTGVEVLVKRVVGSTLLTSLYAICGGGGGWTGDGVSADGLRDLVVRTPAIGGSPIRVYSIFSICSYVVGVWAFKGLRWWFGWGERDSLAVISARVAISTARSSSQKAAVAIEEGAFQVERHMNAEEDCYPGTDEPMVIGRTITTGATQTGTGYLRFATLGESLMRGEDASIKGLVMAYVEKKHAMENCIFGWKSYLTMKRVVIFNQMGTADYQVRRSRVEDDLKMMAVFLPKVMASPFSKRLSTSLVQTFLRNASGASMVQPLFAYGGLHVVMTLRGVREKLENELMEVRARFLDGPEAPDIDLLLEFLREYFMLCDDGMDIPTALADGGIPCCSDLMRQVGEETLDEDVAVPYEEGQAGLEYKAGFASTRGFGDAKVRVMMAAGILKFVLQPGLYRVSCPQSVAYIKSALAREVLLHVLPSKLKIAEGGVAASTDVQDFLLTSSYVSERTFAHNGAIASLVAMSSVPSKTELARYTAMYAQASFPLMAPL